MMVIIIFIESIIDNCLPYPPLATRARAVAVV
jgi:hypothetical protein